MSDVPSSAAVVLDIYLEEHLMRTVALDDPAPQSPSDSLTASVEYGRQIRAELPPTGPVRVALHLSRRPQPRLAARSVGTITAYDADGHPIEVPLEPGLVTEITYDGTGRSYPPRDPSDDPPSEPTIIG